MYSLVVLAYFVQSFYCHHPSISLPKPTEGRCFFVRNKSEFVSRTLAGWFPFSKFASFQRQLNLYGFELINTGPARGGYYHELFVKDRPELCRRMRRVAVKVNPKESSDSNKDSAPDSADKAKTKEEPEGNQVSTS